MKCLHRTQRSASELAKTAKVDHHQANDDRVGYQT
jgi:hypothetical protein